MGVRVRVRVRTRMGVRVRLTLKFQKGLYLHQVRGVLDLLKLTSLKFLKASKTCFNEVAQ